MQAEYDTSISDPKTFEDVEFAVAEVISNLNPYSTAR